MYRQKKQNKAVKHKDKKTCMVLMSVMQKQRGMPKGSLLKVKKSVFLPIIKATPDKDNIILQQNKLIYGYKKLEVNDCAIFLDVVFSSVLRRHYFRFLSGGQILGMEFIKGETFAEIRKSFELLRPGTFDIDEEKQIKKLSI